MAVPEPEPTPDPVGLQRTLPNTFYAAFNMDGLTAKQGWKAAGGTHTIIAAYWDRLEPSQGTIDATALADLKTQFAQAATAGLDVIFEPATHYTPAWIKSGTSAAPRFKAQNGVEYTGSNTNGNDVVDFVFSQTARARKSSFQSRLWAALTTAERAQVKGFRIGGGAYGELHYPQPLNGGLWWGYSTPAQTGTGIATGQAVCPVPGYVPFTGNTTNDAAFTTWYLNALSNYMVWQVTQLRSMGYSGSVHVLHPSFGLRATGGTFAFGGANYVEQAAEGVDWRRQLAAYPDSEVHPQGTWANMRDPWDPENDQQFTFESDMASWRFLRLVAQETGRAALIAWENTGGSPGDWDNNADVDFMFGGTGAKGTSPGFRLTWLNYPRLIGAEGAGEGHATLTHLSGYMAPTAPPAPAPTAVPLPVNSRGINVAGGEFGTSAAQLPGTYGVDYTFDSASTFAYLASRGHTIVRIPFRWERVQPTLQGPLTGEGWTQLQAAVSRAAAAGLKVLLDLHNYGRYTRADDVVLAFGGGLSNADFADLWRRLVLGFAAQPAIVGLGLMNEPNNLPRLPAGFSGVTRYDWSDGLQGWTGDAATATVVSGRLRLSGTSPGAGFFLLRKDDAGTKRGGTITGTSLSAVLTLNSGATGSWTAKLQHQNTSFQWLSAPATTYTRVDTGATVAGLVAGVPVRVTATYTSAFTANAFAVQGETNNAAASTAYSIDVDDFAQGTVSGGGSPWPAASQAAVTAIRAAGDGRAVFVAGDEWSGARQWAQKNGDPWIVDPSNNVVYEAHYYFDQDNSGVYSQSHTALQADAVSRGYADLSARIADELGDFTDWLTTHGQRGFIGEFGWRTNGTETAQWNAVGGAMLDLMDAADLDGSWWSTGEWFGNEYELQAYNVSPLSPRPAALLLEEYAGATTAPPPAPAPPAAAIVASATFDGGSAGGAVSGAPFTSQSGSVLYSTDALHGGMAMTAGPSVGWLGLSVAGYSSWRLRMYVKVASGTQTGSHFLVTTQDAGNGYLADLQIRTGTSGRLYNRFNFEAPASGIAAGGFPTAAYRRVDYAWDGTTCTAYVYTADDTVVDYTLTVPAPAAAARVLIGNGSVNSGLVTRFDSLALTAGGDPGPYATTSTPPAATGAVRVKVAGSLVAATIKGVMQGGVLRPATLRAVGGPVAPSSPFALVLDEQWAGTSVNTSRWKIENSTYGSDGNRIGRYRPENVIVSAATSGGTGNSLKLRSKREFYIDRDFTAGQLGTRDATTPTYYPRYGAYEFRAKIPHGQGLWPAFWLRHRDGSNVCEVDNMEGFHSQIPGRLVSVLHRTDNSGVFRQNVNKGNAFYESPTYTPGWHTIRTEIIPCDSAGNPANPDLPSSFVRFVTYLNGVIMWNYLDTSALNWTSRYNDQAFDICIQGCQIGGNFVGHPDDALGYSRWTNRCLITNTDAGSQPNSCSTSSQGQSIIRAQFTDPASTFELDYVRVSKYVG